MSPDIFDLDQRLSRWVLCALKEFWRVYFPRPVNERGGFGCQQEIGKKCMGLLNQVTLNW